MCIALSITNVLTTLAFQTHEGRIPIYLFICVFYQCYIGLEYLLTLIFRYFIPFWYFINKFLPSYPLTHLVLFFRQGLAAEPTYSLACCMAQAGSERVLLLSLLPHACYKFCSLCISRKFSILSRLPSVVAYSWWEYSLSSFLINWLDSYHFWF